MQTLKRTIIFLTCFVVLLSSFCFGSSASEVYYDPYTGEEMIYDAEEGCYYSLYKPLDFEPIQLYRETSPLYNNFDVNKLPWLEMPSYVQEIANAERIPAGRVATDYKGDYKLPFMAIVVDGTYCRVIAGYNLIVGTRYETEAQKTNDTPHRVSVISRKSELLANNAVCYTARYKLDYYEDYTLHEAWRVVEPVSTGNTFNWYINFNYDEDRDFYFYGVNGTYQDRSIETIKLNSGQTDWFPQFVIVNNPVSGFASGTIVFLPDVWAGYIGTFTPPSPEALQQATSKGILETLKQIPTNIANAIKSFFTSLGDRIGDFFTSLKNYLLYFQETKPEHVNPFENILTDIQNFFDEQNENLRDFKESYLENMNDDSFLGGFFAPFNSVFRIIYGEGFYLTLFVLIIIILFVVRKVIGR